jgi:hypothetical protein
MAKSEINLVDGWMIVQKEALFREIQQINLNQKKQSWKN